MDKQEETRKSQFVARRDLTHQFFKKAKIESCSHILLRSGQSVAVPFDIRNSKGRKMLNFKQNMTRSSELKSIYASFYKKI